MKILVACEESQAVTIELRKLGHEAYSCDIIECSGGHPEWHIQGDVLKILNPSEQRVLMGSTPTPIKNEHAVTPWRGITFRTMDGKLHIIEGKWDMIIAFPPCTHLAVSGARHFLKKRADGRQRKAIEFFCAFLTAECDRIVVENPVGIISGEYILQHFPDLAERYGLPKKPSQIIQPFQFGDHARKTTCLWILGDIPPLHPTNIVEPGEIVGNGYSVGASLDMARDETGKIISWDDPRTAKIRSKTFPGIAKAIAEQMAGAAQEKTVGLMKKRDLIGWKGICGNRGKFVPADEGFAYVCDQVGITAFDYNAPEASEFVASTVEWYFSGNWIEVYEEDEYG